MEYILAGFIFVLVLTIIAWILGGILMTALTIFDDFDNNSKCVWPQELYNIFWQQKATSILTGFIIEFIIMACFIVGKFVIPIILILVKGG